MPSRARAVPGRAWDAVLPTARVDDAARRVLTAMFTAGLFDRTDTKQPIDFDAHAQVAQREEEGAIVLLENRGVLPIAGFHVPARLRKTVRRQPYRITFDQDFNRVILACADARPTTWINAEIVSLYSELHRRGCAHSVEAWQGDALVGGLYGVSLGGAFFGESMFSTARDASKVALVHLVEGLRHGGFLLLDTQFITSHLARFGAIEIPRAYYLRRLQDALNHEALWPFG